MKYATVHHAKKRILIVDNDAAHRKQIKGMLKDLVEIEILESENVSSALEILNKQVAKVILTEIMLPDMSGIDFISEIRTRGINTPVIFLAEHGNKDCIIKALRLGAFDFIEKDCEKDFLLCTVVKALETRDVKLLPRLQSLGLSSTQINILEKLMNGLSNKEIAEEVNLSEQGVKYHVGNFFKIFKIKTRANLREKIMKITNV